jgi:hypothetical protein
MIRVDKVTGILECKNRFVFLSALSCFTSVDCQHLANLNFVVLKETICSFGFCPIYACLVDGTLWGIRKSFTQFNQPRSLLSLSLISANSSIAQLDLILEFIEILSLKVDIR